jgi:methionyl-tRNA formyltransferase
MHKQVRDKGRKRTSCLANRGEHERLDFEESVTDSMKNMTQAMKRWPTAKKKKNDKSLKLMKVRASLGDYDSPGQGSGTTQRPCV